MAYQLTELSVFFPCYNEESNIESTVSKALPLIKEIAPKWEVLLINDGSKDKTLKKCQLLAKKYPNIRVINHPHNRGYGAAFKSGLYGSIYNWIVFTDADGQFDFQDINLLIQTQKSTQADMVIGFYLGRQVSLVRKFGSAIWQIAVYLLFGLKVKDIDCGFKMINKKIPDTIPPLEAERGPFINSEFLIKSIESNFHIVEVGVHHYPRTAGVATGANLNVVIAGFKDLFRLWFKLKIQRA